MNLLDQREFEFSRFSLLLLRWVAAQQRAIRLERQCDALRRKLIFQQISERVAFSTHYNSVLRQLEEPERELFTAREQAARLYARVEMMHKALERPA